jgi:predicted TIM-barrel fold metal-dependent hydrolase
VSIDCHIHLFRQTLKTVPNARHLPSYDATLEMLRPLAAKAKVGRFVIVQTSFLGTNNDYLVEEITKDPENLRGVVILAPNCTAQDIADLHRQGVVGLRLNLFKTNLEESLSDEHLSLVERCSAQGWSIGIHDDAARLPEILDRIGDRAPKLVVDHFGRPESYGGDIHHPDYRALLERLVRLGAFVKISAAYRSPGLNVPKAIALLESELGIDKLLWGSDWPWTQHESGRDYTDWSHADGRPESLAQRLANNAKSFYEFN